MYVTKKYIENKLINYVEKIDYKNINEIEYNNVREYNPEETLLVQTGIKRYIIKFLFKYKNFIKKIPVLGKYIVNKKNKMYKEAYGDVSINHILNLSPYLFIKNLYKIAFNRDVDKDGMSYYLSLYKDFATNESVAYEIFRSEEYGNRATVENIHIYKKAYRRYKKKSKMYSNIFLKCLFLVFGGFYFAIKRDKVVEEYKKALLEYWGK